MAQLMRQREPLAMGVLGTAHQDQGLWPATVEPENQPAATWDRVVFDLRVLLSQSLDINRRSKPEARNKRLRENLLAARR